MSHSTWGRGTPWDASEPWGHVAPLLSQASVLKARLGAVLSSAPHQIWPLPRAAMGPGALHSGSPNASKLQHEPCPVVKAAAGAFRRVTAVLLVTLQSDLSFLPFRPMELCSSTGITVCFHSPGS